MENLKKLFHVEQTTAREWVLIGALFLLGAWARYLYIFDYHPLRNFISTDMWEYASQAERIANGTATGTSGYLHPSFKPQGFYFIVATSIKLALSKITSDKWTLLSWSHFFLSLGTAFLMWSFCRKWLGRDGALAALVFGLFHFPFLFYTGYVLAETWFTFFLAVLVCLLFFFRYPWRPWQSALLGLIWGVGVVIKGQSTLFAPLAFFTGFFLIKAPKLRERLVVTVKTFIPFALAGACFLLAQIAYVYRMEGRLVLSPTVSAVNFVHSKCPTCRTIKGKDGRGVGIATPSLLEEVLPSYECVFDHELEDASFFWKKGLSCIKESPTELVKSLGHPIKLFLGNEPFPGIPTEFHSMARLYNFLYLLFVYPGILFGLLRSLSRRKSKRTSLAFALAWSGILPFVLLLEAEIRFRIPFDVILMPISLWGWMGLGRALRWRKEFAAYMPYAWMVLFVPWIVNDLVQKWMKDPYPDPVSPFIVSLGMALLLATVALRFFQQSLPLPAKNCHTNCPEPASGRH